MKSSIPHNRRILRPRFIKRYTWLLPGMLLFIAMLFSGKTFTQTILPSKLSCNNQDRCTSNDLQVVKVEIDAPACTTCSSGETVTFPLKMTIHNGTGSTRTSFSLYGTLSSNAKINGISGNIFVCVGPITVTKGDQTFAVGNISYTCGQELTLTNNYLAWTDASGTTTDRCNTYSQATKCSDIAPKCGTAAVIPIIGPVAASASDEQDPCRNAATPNGKIKVTPSGGTAPYTIALYKSTNGECSASAPSTTADYSQTNVTGAVTATGLAAGTYCCYVSDSKGCKVPAFKITIGHDCCTPPAAPTVCQVPADLCGDGKVVLKVGGTVKDAVYHCKQANTEVTGSPKTATSDGQVLEFKVAPGGGNIEVYGVTSTGPDDVCTGASTTSDCAKSPNGISVCNTGGARIVGQGKTTEQEIVLSKQQLTSVVAAPNPFSDRIRFTLKSEVSGRGSLELFNSLGQKVKTVFQGEVSAGQAQTIDYALPGPQRAGLIYVFRVGNQQTTGKLIGLSNK